MLSPLMLGTYNLVPSLAANTEGANAGMIAHPVCACPVAVFTHQCYMAQALQAAQHVRKGMQLASGGHLKQSKWTDRTTGMQMETMRV